MLDGSSRGGKLAEQLWWMCRGMEEKRMGGKADSLDAWCMVRSSYYHGMSAIK